MITFKFEKPEVVGNVREEVEPYLKEYIEYLKEAKKAREEADMFEPAKRAKALAALASAVKNLLYFEGQPTYVDNAVVSSAPRVGKLFNGRPFWHVDTARDFRNLRMMASSTPPLIASGAISFDKSLYAEAAHRSNPAQIGSDTVLTTLFKIISERVQNRSELTSRPSVKQLDWVDVAARGELAESRYHMLDGLVVVEDLEHFRPDDYDVVEGEIDRFLHTPAPRAAGDPTVRVFGRAYFI